MKKLLRNAPLVTHEDLATANEQNERDEFADLVNFPVLDEAAHQGLAGEVLAAIAPHTEAHPIGILLSFLVAVGTALGTSIKWLVSGTAHPLRIHAVLVGRTGQGRKGTSWSAAKLVLTPGLGETFMQQNITAGLSTGEGLIEAVKDDVKKMLHNKTTGKLEDTVVEEGVHDKRTIVLETEMGRVLQVMHREGNTLSTTMRQAWDIGGDDVLRILTKNSTRATGAHIGLLGHITRDELLRHLQDTEVAAGFANRILWVAVRRVRLLPFGGSPDEDDIARLGRRLDDVVAWAKEQGKATLSWSSGAMEMWKVLYPKLSEGSSGLSGAVLSRAEAQVMRLAGLYAVLDKTLKVAPSHLEAAVAIWDYCGTSAEIIFGTRTGDQIADAILEALHTSGRMNRTQIFTLFKRNIPASRIETAVETLVRDGKAQVVKDASKAGRPSQWLEAVTDG